MIDWTKAYSPAEVERARQARKAAQKDLAARDKRVREYVEMLVDADLKKLEGGEPL